VKFTHHTIPVHPSHAGTHRMSHTPIKFSPTKARNALRWWFRQIDYNTNHPEIAKLAIEAGKILAARTYDNPGQLFAAVTQALTQAINEYWNPHIETAKEPRALDYAQSNRNRLLDRVQHNLPNPRSKDPRAEQLLQKFLPKPPTNPTLGDPML
jgi:hypothetical protein